MATQTRSEGKARSFGENIESDLASRFLRVVEVAAIASARTMGQGERKLSDQVATGGHAAHYGFHPHARDHCHWRGRARTKAPMLYIGEKVGRGISRRDAKCLRSTIAVDPLEGTNLCATGAPGSITVLCRVRTRRACSTLPTATWEKIVVGPSCQERCRTRCTRLSTI